MRSTTARSSDRAPRSQPTISSLGTALRTSPQPPVSRKRFSAMALLAHSLMRRHVRSRRKPTLGRWTAIRVLTDAVEKVGDQRRACNFILLAYSFLNQFSPLCAFLESILHRDPPQNLFSTVSNTSGRAGTMPLARIGRFRRFLVVASILSSAAVGFTGFVGPCVAASP